MSTATVGFYSFFWFYQNWRLVQLRSENPVIVPKWRAIFAAFYCYPLFRTINQAAITHQVPTRFNPIVLSLAWIGLVLCIQLPEPYYYVYLLSVFALLPVQRTVNQLNAQLAPGHNPNHHFSTGNVALIIAGTVAYTLSLS